MDYKKKKKKKQQVEGEKRQEDAKARVPLALRKSRISFQVRDYRHCKQAETRSVGN